MTKIGRSSQVCRRWWLQTTEASQPLVWIRAFESSTLPLPSDKAVRLARPKAGVLGFENALINATLLEWNWTTSTPIPRTRSSYSTPVSEAWLFRGRFVVTANIRGFTCWDLYQPHSKEPVWEVLLGKRVNTSKADEMDVNGLNGIVLAYSVA